MDFSLILSQLMHAVHLRGIQVTSTHLCSLLKNAEKFMEDPSVKALFTHQISSFSFTHTQKELSLQLIKPRD